jgi:chromosome segregation ATPase
MNSKQIIITFIIFIALIGTGWYCYDKFKPKTSTLEDEPIDTIEENDDSIQKIESTSIEKSKETKTPKPEIEPKNPISQTRFDEIKNYILSLDDNLLPKNLNTNEKTKIEEIRTPIKSAIQRSQSKLDDYEKVIVELQNKLKDINNLNDKLQLNKESAKQYNERIQQKKDEFPKAPNVETRKRLQNELNQLCTEQTELINEIMNIGREIKIENERHYDNMLKNAEDSKQQLVKNFETLKSNNEKTAIDELNKIYIETNDDSIQKTESTSTLEDEPINTIEENDDSIQKTESTPIEKSKEVETPKPEIEPKIPISQTRFDEIKNYILSLDDNLLPSNLNTNEKTKIEEIRTPIKSTIQESQLKLNAYEKIIIEIQKKITNENDLNTKKHQLEESTKQYNERIKQKEDEFPKAPDTETRKRLQNELNQLYAEQNKLINEIMNIGREIKNEDEKSTVTC